MENITFHVAADRIDKQLLLEMVSAVLIGDDENEELKLKIYNAIRVGNGEGR